MNTASETADGARPSRLRRLAKGLLVSFGALLVTILLFEIVLRIFTEHRPRWRIVDPVLGARYASGWEGDVYKPEVKDEVRLRFNEHGFRFPDVPFEKPAGTRRIVFLGDSMIAGEDVVEEETAAVRLERELDASDPGHDWEVLNFGIPGAGTGQEYVLYRELASRFQPDIVLCAFFVGNDFGDNSNRFSSGTRLYFELDEAGDLVQLPFPPLGLRVRTFLARHSRFYIWQKKMIKKLKDEVRREEHTDPLEERHAWHGERVRSSEWIYYSRIEEKEDVAHSWSITRAAIQALGRETAADGAALALVLVPAPEQVHDEDFAYLLSVAGPVAPDLDPEHPGRRLGEICAELGVPFIDLLPDFREAAPSHSQLAEDEWLYLNGRGHFNARGHALVASTIAKRIQEVFPERWAGGGER